MIQKIEVGDLVGETIDGETYFGMVITKIRKDKGEGWCIGFDQDENSFDVGLGHTLDDPDGNKINLNDCIIIEKGHCFGEVRKNDT